MVRSRLSGSLLPLALWPLLALPACGGSCGDGLPAVDAGPGAADAAVDCSAAAMIADPGFQDPGAWAAARGAAINPTEAGEVDDGAAIFDLEATCAGASLRQTIAVPPLACGHLVAEVTYRVTYNDSPAAPDLAVGVGGAFAVLRRGDRNQWTKGRVCLGSAGHGGDRELIMRRWRTAAARRAMTRPSWRSIASTFCRPSPASAPARARS